MSESNIGILARLVETVNLGDTEGFLALFSDNGYVDDWGRTFEGHNAIRRWSDEEFIGAQGHMDVQSQEIHGDSDIIIANWTSQRFNGPSRFAFTFQNGQIFSMYITGE